MKKVAHLPELRCKSIKQSKCFICFIIILNFSLILVVLTPPICRCFGQCHAACPGFPQLSHIGLPSEVVLGPSSVAEFEKQYKSNVADATETRKLVLKRTR